LKAVEEGLTRRRVEARAGAEMRKRKRTKRQEAE
jgi:hypothetical protein